MNSSVELKILRKAGLVYVNDQEPGITREKRGKSFCYRLPTGELLCDNEIKTRIKALGIPPAYRDVWICQIDNGHLQATGFDERGRKQYRYHVDWQSLRGEKKFHELVAFGHALPRIRRRATADAEKIEDGEKSTLAALVLLLDAAHLRVGNRYYLEENGTYGATTLLKRHVSFGETLELSFAAKGGKKVRQRLKAPRLQRILERIADLPGRKLFVWQDDEGSIRPVDSGQLNRYISEIAGTTVSAKTFRTWGGTKAAFGYATDLIGKDEAPTIRAMTEAAAAELSNTPAVCRKSYVHPRVLDLANDPALVEKLKKQLEQKETTRDGLRAVEHRLLTFLEN